MSVTSLEVFDETVHQTNRWLNEISEEIGPDRHRAYHALRATLQTLRDRLTVEEAAHLSAQLPMLVRGLYFEGWRPADTPQKWRSEEEFTDKLAERMSGTPPMNPRQAAISVFRVLSDHITEGEREKVKKMLPKEIRDLWPDQAGASGPQAS